MPINHANDFRKHFSLLHQYDINMNKLKNNLKNLKRFPPAPHQLFSSCVSLYRILPTPKGLVQKWPSPRNSPFCKQLNWKSPFLEWPSKPLPRRSVSYGFLCFLSSKGSHILNTQIESSDSSLPFSHFWPEPWGRYWNFPWRLWDAASFWSRATRGASFSNLNFLEGPQTGVWSYLNGLR